MEPSVFRCRILAPYVPLRATSSASVPCDDIVYILQRTYQKTEFRKCLTVIILLFPVFVTDIEALQYATYILHFIPLLATYCSIYLYVIVYNK